MKLALHFQAGRNLPRKCLVGRQNSTCLKIKSLGALACDVKRTFDSIPAIPRLYARKSHERPARLNRQCRKLFLADPGLKDRAARLLRSLLPPSPGDLAGQDDQM